MDKIEGFKDEYRFLSNFYPIRIIYEGIEYPSVEHAYQAMKSLDNNIRIKISKIPTAGKAKRAGAKLKPRNNWHNINLIIMEDLVNQKFRNEFFSKKLLDTKDMFIEETNDWGDTFWGVCEGKGTNYLGKIIMKVREELKNVNIK